MRVTAAPWVVKIGGRLCDDVGIRQGFADACARLSQPLVLVHGGGSRVTELQNKFGVAPRFFEGRRMTEASDMQLVEMALSGTTNKDLVRALTRAGRAALGMSGCDGNLIRCDVVPSLGAVGVPRHIDTRILSVLLHAGYTPVIAPVSLGPDLQPLNVNADEVACAVAESLGAERLLLISDVSAVRVGGTAQDVIVDADVEALIDAGDITDGMIPKMRAAAHAVQRGVGQVRIGGFTQDLHDVQGTQVVSAARSGAV